MIIHIDQIPHDIPNQTIIITTICSLIPFNLTNKQASELNERKEQHNPNTTFVFRLILKGVECQPLLT